MVSQSFLTSFLAHHFGEERGLNGDNCGSKEFDKGKDDADVDLSPRESFDSLLNEPFPPIGLYRGWWWWG